MFDWQCWLKRQKDPLNPDIHDTAQSNPWTSGLIFEKDDVWKFFPSFDHDDARGNMSMTEFKTYSWMLRLEVSFLQRKSSSQWLNGPL